MYAQHVSSSHRLNARDVAKNVYQELVFRSWCASNSAITVASARNVRMDDRPCRVAFVCENIGLRAVRQIQKR